LPPPFRPIPFLNFFNIYFSALAQHGLANIVPPRDCNRSSKTFPDASSIELLPDLVSELQKHVNEVRRAGRPAAIIAAANAAADAIEQRVGVCSNDAERAALTAVKRFTYNAAADCWPGWSVTGPAVDASSLLAALQLAQRSAALVESLALGSVQEGTAIWLSGAFELALRRLTEASSSFARARQCYITAAAPGLVLLMDGYLTIVQLLATNASQADAENFEQICAKIAGGGFEDGPAWSEQLRTALKAFT
jgi:hypothetical protein